jgi:hypothetical protein
LGIVRWQPGDPGRFAARNADDLVLSSRRRRYCGAVAGSVEAAAGQVRVHDRSQPYSAFFTDELLWVEGKLRLDGHARLYGARIEFVRDHGETPPAPFHLLRRDDPASGRKKLQVVVGDQSAGENRFVVGTKTGVGGSGEDVHSEHFVVTDEGKVGVATADPLAPLHLPQEGVQIGTSATPADNFHVQSDTSGPRGLRLYNGDTGSGTHLLSVTQLGRVGIGVTDPSNRLHVDGALGVRQNALFLSGDGRWSSFTFNAHHNEANNGWVFPDPAQPAVTVEIDAWGGPRFEVFSTRVGDNQSWTSRLKVFGHSGDLGMAANGGRVGIGTYSPTAKLDVRGDLRVDGEIELGNPARRPVAAVTGLRMLWGNVSDAGTRLTGEGFTPVRLGAGRYQLTFDEPFSSRPTAVVTKVYRLFTADSGTGVEPQQNAIIDQLEGNFAIVATANADGDLEDSNFCFLVVGPR